MESRTHVWKVATDGSAPARQISFGEKGDSQPQFSPDGKFISFVSARGSAEAKSQIYLMPIDGGEAWKLTDAKENVSAYSWAPDGSTIAFVATDPRSADEEANIKKRDDERVFEGDFRFAHAWVSTSTPSRRRASPRAPPTPCRARRRGRRTASGSCSAPPTRRCCATTAAMFTSPTWPTEDSVEKISTNWGNDGHAALVAGRRDDRVGRRAEHAPRRIPDGTAVGRGDAAAPDALRRQRQDASRTR